MEIRLAFDFGRSRDLKRRRLIRSDGGYISRPLNFKFVRDRGLPSGIYA